MRTTVRLVSSRSFAAMFAAVLMASPLACAEDEPSPVTALPSHSVSPEPTPPAAVIKSHPSFLSEEATLWDVFLKGGWAMWPILGCATIGLVFFFERAIDLQRRKHGPKG